MLTIAHSMQVFTCARYILSMMIIRCVHGICASAHLWLMHHSAQVRYIP